MNTGHRKTCSCAPVLRDFCRQLCGCSGECQRALQRAWGRPRRREESKLAFGIAATYKDDTDLNSTVASQVLPTEVGHHAVHAPCRVLG